MMQPLVSIIIPAYNSGKYIDQCLQSVVAQTYKNWEAIIVLAPSTDDTYDKIRRYFNNNIHVIRESEKTTCAAARNIGFKVCKGEYVCFLDADDWWEPEKLSKQVEFTQKKMLDWSAHDLIVNSKDKTTIDNNTLGDFNKGDIGHGLHTVLASKRMLENVKAQWGYLFYEKMDRVDDGDLLVRLHPYLHDALHIPLSHFRVNSDGLTSNTDSIRQLILLIGICVRNRIYHPIPNYTKDLLLTIAEKITGVDWVQFKKLRFG